MSLIKCVECGKEISDTTNKCPHCGKKNPSGKQKQFTPFAWIGIFFIISLLSLIIYFNVAVRTHKNPLASVLPDPRFPRDAATHIVQLDRVQIGAKDFNLSTFGNPLDIEISLLANGSKIPAQGESVSDPSTKISGKRGERNIQPIQWIVNFDPQKNYQIVLEEKSIIADARRWSLPGTPKIGYWPIGENNGTLRFGVESYLHFIDKVTK